MSDELGAVLEAPEVTTEEVVEQPSEVTETESVVETPEVKGDERTMPAWIRNLKAADPAAFKEAKATFFGKRAVDEKLKDFDLDGVKGWLEEKGGREALEASFSELQGKAQELEEISTKLLNDPEALVADVFEVAPDSIGRLAEAVTAQWAKADPEGWGSAMSSVMAATIQQNGIPLFLERMAMALEFGKADAVPGMIKQLQDWAGSFQAKALVQRTNTVQPDKKFTEREQQLNQREEQAFNSEMERSVDSFRDPLIAKELDTFFKRRPNDKEAQELAASTVKAKVIERMKGDETFQKSLNALWVRKDKEGALRLIKSRETAAIAEIAPKVGRTIFGNPGAAAAPKSGEKETVATGTKPEAGFSVVDKPPAPQLIDRVKTSDAMIMRGKFILKDGKKLMLAE
jgi:hypothetical protein